MARIIIAFVAACVLFGYSLAAPVSDYTGAPAYTCDSQTETCSCTSYDDCKRLDDSGHCKGGGVNLCSEKAGNTTCRCQFDAYAESATSAGASSPATPSYACQNEPGKNSCLCTSYFDCEDMRTNACTEGSFSCIPGTFVCNCEWKSALKYGDEKKPKEGRTSTAPVKASAGSSGECDPETEPELPEEGPPPSKSRPEWAHGYNRCVDGEWQYVKPAWVHKKKR